METGSDFAIGLISSPRWEQRETYETYYETYGQGTYETYGQAPNLDNLRGLADSDDASM